MGAESKSRKRGQAMLSTLVASMLLAILSISVTRTLAKANAASNAGKTRLLAESKLTELSEYLRSQTHSQIITGPLSNYALCQTINDGLQSSPFDLITAMPSDALGTNITAVRSYSVHVVDLANYTSRDDLCGGPISSLSSVTLSPTETILFNVSITWGKPLMPPERQVATVLSDFPAAVAATGSPKLIFIMQLPRTTSRSRTLFSTFCSDAAATAGRSGIYKAIISLSPRYPTHPDDRGWPMDARDYLQVAGPIVNVNDEVIANDAATFWSLGHLARIKDFSGTTPPFSISTGSTADGRFPNTCASSDPGGNARGCNCGNLQNTDEGTFYRFSGGGWGSTPPGTPPTDDNNWAFYLVTSNSGNTVCTFNSASHQPTYIYCLQQ